LLIGCGIAMIAIVLTQRFKYGLSWRESVQSIWDRVKKLDTLPSIVITSLLGVAVIMTIVKGGRS
jgi:hypothetical protein